MAGTDDANMDQTYVTYGPIVKLVMIVRICSLKCVRVLIDVLNLCF